MPDNGNPVNDSPINVPDNPGPIAGNAEPVTGGIGLAAAAKLWRNSAELAGPPTGNVGPGARTID